jgi:hypothetical protein
LILLSFIVVTIWWFTSAKKWFKGPRVQGTPEELREIERALEAGDVATFRKLEGSEP